MIEAESLLRQQLANLHVQYLRGAEPIFTQLARIEALKPPRPVWLAGAWMQLNPEVFASITGDPAPAPETPGARMIRLEHQLSLALHILRMVKEAKCAPPYLAAHLEQTLRDIDG